MPRGIYATSLDNEPADLRFYLNLQVVPSEHVIKTVISFFEYTNKQQEGN